MVLWRIIVAASLCRELERYVNNTNKSSVPPNVEFSMSLLAALVVEEIARRSKKKKSDILADFMKSNTARMLYDQDTGLWTCGPAYIEDEYRLEASRKGKADS